MYGYYGELPNTCRRLQSLRHRGLAYLATSALETTYPNIGKYFSPDAKSLINYIYPIINTVFPFLD